MGKNSSRRKPATPAQIEKIKVVVRDAMEKIYGDLLLDNAFGNAISQPSSNGFLSEGDRAYIKKIVGLHANITDSLLCLSVLLLCNFRAEEPIEKKFLLRRIVVICHELYKYLYGFTNKKTEWEVIALKLEDKYPVECAELMAQGEKYLKKYGQSEDKILRDVSNHYSDKPFEFNIPFAALGFKERVAAFDLVEMAELDLDADALTLSVPAGGERRFRLDALPVAEKGGAKR